MRYLRGLVALVRWLAFAPAAAAMVPVVDGVVEFVLQALGIADRSLPWLAGKLIGHFLMGGAGITLGTWIAPGYKRVAWALLVILAILAAIAAIRSGELPLSMNLPLMFAFLSGAIGTAIVLQRDRREGPLLEESHRDE